MTVELASSSGVGAMRVTRSAGRSPIALGVRHFSRGLESRARNANVRFPGATAGVGVSSAELVCHPGHSSDDELGALGWDYRGQDELDALVSSEARVMVERAGFRLGTFADLDATQPVKRETRR